jgi:hypothetical protein
MDELKDYLANKVLSFNAMQKDLYAKRYDMTLTKTERDAWRDLGNKVTARRHEIEDVEAFLESKNYFK